MIKYLVPWKLYFEWKLCFAQIAPSVFEKSAAYAKIFSTMQNIASEGTRRS